ncbi:MAG: hypothetical protein ACRECJ_11275, partial [Limisphaerales bacterium]
MRVFVALQGVGVLLLAANLTAARRTLPATGEIRLERGIGPAGVVESLDDTQFPEPSGLDLPDVLPYRFEMDETAIHEIKNHRVPVGDNVAKVIRMDSRRERALTPTAAPPLETNFAGLFASNLAPPDPCMAVGPNHIILSVNTRFNIYNKNGATQAANSYATFFSNVNSLPSVFDPKVVYDHYSGRWIVVILAVSNSASAYLIAVSDDSDPRGTWYKYSSPAHIDGSTPTSHGADYPGIGFDHEAVYITSNQFANFVTGGFMYSKIRIFKKSELYNNAAPPLTYTDITRMVDPSDGEFTFTIKPVVPWDSISGTFLVNTQGSLGTNVELWRLSNALTSPVLTHLASVPIGTYSAPPDAVQPLGAPLVNTNNSTLQSEVHYRNGRLYFAFPQAYDFGGGTVSAVRYLEMDTTGGLVQNIIYGADGENHFFPAPIPLASGNVAMVFSHSSA